MRPSFVIISPEPPIVVLDRLNAAFGCRTYYAEDGYAYNGELWDRGFRLMRLPRFFEKESQVVIAGQITPAETGTTIAVTVSMKSWLSLLYGAVLGLFILISFTEFMHREHTHELHPIWLCVQIAIIVVGIVMTYETEGQRVFNALTGIILPFGKQRLRQLRRNLSRQ